MWSKEEEAALQRGAERDIEIGNLQTRAQHITRLAINRSFRASVLTETLRDLNAVLSNVIERLQ